MMYTQRINTASELLPYRDRWDNLAGDCPFRCWAWLTTWWKHYGKEHELFVLLVFADDEVPNCQSSSNCNESANPEQLVGILPCYIESTFARGRVLRFLGDGEVCTDHLDVLAAPDDLKPVTESLARYLYENAADWDSTEFTAIGADCPGIQQLSDELRSLGCHVNRSPNENRWAIALPEDWEAFLAMQSKSHRKQLRRLERRVLDTEQAVWHLVDTSSGFEVAWPILIDLHQRRRISLGEPGCFASQRWAEFHRDVARQLLDDGKLRLSWLEIAGQPVAAEYHFADSCATYAYQGGVDPDRIDEEPGKLSMIRTFQHALDEGHKHFDLLRGDEPYKAHWRAEPIETFDFEIVPARSSALWRSQACNYLQGAARLARQFTNLLS